MKESNTTLPIPGAPSSVSRQVARSASREAAKEAQKVRRLQDFQEASAARHSARWESLPFKVEVDVLGLGLDEIEAIHQIIEGSRGKKMIALPEHQEYAVVSFELMSDAQVLVDRGGRLLGE